MIEFPDLRSVDGRTGALTVVGPIRSAGIQGLLYPTVKRLAPILQYADMGDLRLLHALRFTVVKVRSPDPVTLLVFETVFHGDWGQYLTHLVRMTSKGIDMQALGALGYPGTADVRTFVQYLIERHRPAAHVYAANPMLSPNDCRQLIKRNPLDEGTARWWGVILKVRARSTTELIDLCASWTNSTSPFAAAAVHHGRVVLIESPGATHVLISAVYRSTSDDGPRPYRDDIADVRDRELLMDMVSGTRASAWLDLLALTDAGGGAVGDVIDALLARRMIRRGPTIRWVDSHWTFLPGYLKRRAELRQWGDEADLPVAEPTVDPG